MSARGHACAIAWFPTGLPIGICIVFSYQIYGLCAPQLSICILVKKKFDHNFVFDGSFVPSHILKDYQYLVR